MADLKFGLIGCGQVAASAHLPLLSKIPGVVVSALADTDPSAVGRCSQMAPNAKRFTEWSALLAAGNLNAVVISLPTHLHADAAVAAFDAGIDVYLEKPVAASLSDASLIETAWRASGRIGAIGHNYRFNPLFADIAQRVRRGDIGKPTSAQTVFTSPMSARHTWRASRSSGGGAVLDLASHHIDLLRFILAAEIESVAARIESRDTDHDSASLELSFDSGASATIKCAYGQAFSNSITIHGPRGSLSADLGASIMRSVPTPRRIRHFLIKMKAPFHEPSYKVSLRLFTAAVKTRAQFKPDVEDGLIALRSCIAAEESARSGQRVVMADFAEAMRS